MTPTQERYAEALALLRLHGERAPLFVAERLGALALAGDTAGITRWQAIAYRMQEVITASRQSH